MTQKATATMKWSEMKPDWWPDWMGPPALMANGYAAPLGACMKCGARQYPMSWTESHALSCSRAGEKGKPPWSHSWAGWPLIQEVED